MEEIEEQTIRKEQDEQAEERIKERKKNRMNRKKATKKKGNKGRTKEGMKRIIQYKQSLLLKDPNNRSSPSSPLSPTKERELKVALHDLIPFLRFWIAL